MRIPAHRGTSAWRPVFVDGDDFASVNAFCTTRTDIVTKWQAELSQAHVNCIGAWILLILSVLTVSVLVLVRLIWQLTHNC